MAVKVLLLGRPGSGKTTAARHLAKLAGEKRQPVIHIDDYEILQERFRADSEHRRFRPLGQGDSCGGFDVTDFRVLDEVLEETETYAQRYMASMPHNGLIIIEFARGDYCSALKLFSPEFLQDAYIIFFTVDTETSVRRVRQRYLKTGYRLISEDILRNYYRDDDLHAMIGELKASCGLCKAIHVCDNAGSWRDFFRQLNQFFSLFVEEEIGIV